MAFVSTGKTLPTDADFVLVFTLKTLSVGAVAILREATGDNFPYAISRIVFPGSYLTAGVGGDHSHSVATPLAGNRFSFRHTGTSFTGGQNGVEGSAVSTADTLNGTDIEVDSTYIDPTTVEVYTTTPTVQTVREDWAQWSGRSAYNHPVTDWLTAQLTALSATTQHVYSPPEAGDGVLVDLEGTLHGVAVNGAAPAAQTVPIVGWPSLAPTLDGTDYYSFGDVTWTGTGLVIALVAKLEVSASGQVITGSTLSAPYLIVSCDTSAGDVAITLLDDSSNVIDMLASGGAPITDGEPHLYVLRIDRTGHSLWIDGVAISLSTVTDGSPEAISGNLTDMQLGAVDGGNLVTGYIQPLAIATGVAWTDDLSRMLYDRCMFAGILC